MFCLSYFSSSFCTNLCRHFEDFTCHLEMKTQTRLISDTRLELFTSHQPRNGGWWLDCVSSTLRCCEGIDSLCVARLLLLYNVLWLPFVFPPAATSLFVLVLEKLVATDGNYGDECHELLKVALGVAVGVQAVHQAVQRSLVIHMLQGGRTGSARDNKTPNWCLTVYVICF